VTYGTPLNIQVSVLSVLMLSSETRVAHLVALHHGLTPFAGRKTLL
jgi:hypothetical protein